MLCALPENRERSRPQRKNGPVIETCKKCGAVNEGHAETCCFCDAKLPEAERVLAAAGRAAPARDNLATQVDWRREVSHRLKAYRARQNRPCADNAQPTLPFSTGPSKSDSNGSYTAPGDVEHELADERASVLAPDGAAEANLPPSRTPRSDRVERVEIAVHQPALDFAGTEVYHPSPRASLYPVAELGERQRAGLLDAAFLLLAYAGVLGLFRSLGGHFSFGRLDLLVYAVTTVLFYAQYFALFTALGGSTPGMLLRRLRVVSFDGSAPTPRQLLWRSFGYLISVGTVLLGFLWALWDEDRLTWQDRISQTYLTHCPEHLGESESPRGAL